MVDQGHRTRSSARWVGYVLLAATVGVCGARAQEPAASSAPSRLRPVDPMAAALMEAGKARSATFRHLAEALERTDLIVWIAAGQLPHPGQIELVTATPFSRYVRVDVRLPGLENDLVATLAHELQHALEIAGAPEVRDGRSLRRFYERVGRGGPAGATAVMETEQAQKTGLAVLNELLDSPATRRPVRKANGSRP